MKILIVDDNPIYVALLKNKLSQTKISLQVVGSAANITEARTLISQHQPNILIVDIELETETIFELFDHIDYKDFEIIFASGSDRYATSVLEVEAIGYLVKPVNLSLLENLLLIAQSNLQSKSVL